MSVPNFLVQAAFAGNDLADSFPTGIKIERKTDLVVWTVPGGSPTSPLTLGSGYTVTGDKSVNGCTVKLIAGPLASGTYLICRRIIEPLQNAVFSRWSFDPKAFEAALDLSMELHQQAEFYLGAKDINRRRVIAIPDLDDPAATVRADARGWIIGSVAEPEERTDAATRGFVEDTVGAAIAGVVGGGGGNFLGQFTLATRPTAGAAYVNKVCIVKDPGAPAYVQMCLEKATTGQYSWVTLASGDV